MPGNETPTQAPEKVEAPKNSFTLTTQPDAQKLMDAWKMKIENNQISFDGKVDSKFDGTKNLDVSQQNGTLVVVETMADGTKATYKGASPEELHDNLIYVGYKGFAEAFPNDSRSSYA